jgi:ABC-2 type transport system ATP-binding protein
VRARDGIGFLPENLNLPPEWSAKGLLAMAALAAGDSAHEDIDRALELAGVDFDRRMRVAVMSKGMRQRLGLAMTLVPLPRLLILDEPEAGLDPAQRVLLRERMRAFAHAGTGRIVLLATHDVSSLVAMADDAFIVRNGRLEEVLVNELSDPRRIVELFSTGPRP